MLAAAEVHRACCRVCVVSQTCMAAAAMPLLILSPDHQPINNTTLLLAGNPKSNNVIAVR